MIIGTAGGAVNEGKRKRSGGWAVRDRAEKGQNILGKLLYGNLTGQKQPSIPQERISFSRQFQTEDILIPLVALQWSWVVFTQG
jgi:hypothetical protein